MNKALTLTLLFALLLPPQMVSASIGECQQRVNNELGRELRLYRNVLFGKPRAKDASVGEVRYDTDGWAWIKTSADSLPWRNSHPDQQSLQWSDSVMDESDEHAESLPLVGIFETKRTTTSELIPYLLQSIRAFECRALTLCNVVRASEGFDVGADPQDLTTLQQLGCIEFENLKSFPECHLAKESSGQLEKVDSRGYCNDMVEQTMRRERDLLKLVVEYDAGFRSLLQFAGNFDIFLKEMRWPLANTIRQATELIGSLKRIPCFISSCDSSPAAN
ncbi:hypothetical protein HOL63_01950 [Candidatus Peregrinibacteria bacterium]|jgi:hypothetical protein|nr:hypothetical protein [Candidatus Peregrinibacteria bacterium]MBT5468453.1 hypothetical protein [Candidatus Peregrinibacteria bacterium]MBT7337964.1 hypothetical protein [Candidatus Peregrinibacteria bacterium]